MNKVEILAPAGDFLALESACKAGADAVYLGGQFFGARAYASNFDNEKIKEAVNYAHLRDVKVFVTVNTVILEDEFNDCLKFIDYLVSINVDGLIIQDLGLMEVVHKTYPSLYIVASTQMNIHNVEGAQFVKNMGASRVVLGRETPLEMVKKICKNVDIDVEVFIHGALCVSYSGQCLLSSFIGQRSGNRGKCAQPCRLDYTLVENDKELPYNGPLLSTKDLMTLEYLNEIVDSGVKSLKIEGRMKSKEYVYVTVKAYKQALLIHHINKQDIIDIKKTFNREFTKGYLNNEKDVNLVNIKANNHQGIRIGEVKGYRNGRVTISLHSELNQGDAIRIKDNKDEVGFYVNKLYYKGRLTNHGNKGDIVEVECKHRLSRGDVLKTVDKKLNEEIEVKLKEDKKINVDMDILLFIGKPIKINVKCNNVKFSVESDFIIEKANNNIDEDRIINQLGKLGNSLYSLKSCKVVKDDFVLVPMSILNKMKNDIINELDTRRLQYKKLEKQEYKLPILDIKEHHEISVLVSNLEQYNAIKDIKNIKILVPSKLYDLINDKQLVNNVERVMDHYNEYDKVNISDFGGFLSKHNVLTSSEYMNVTNVNTLIKHYSLGTSKVTLSLENNFDNANKIYNDFNKLYGFNPNIEMVVYGRNDLMLLKYCPIHKLNNIDVKNCNLCRKSQYFLKDRYNFLFPLMGNSNCDVKVLNNRIINLIDDVNKIKDIASIKLIFTLENKNETKHIVEEFIKAYNNEGYELHLNNYKGYFDKEL